MLVDSIQLCTPAPLVARYTNSMAGRRAHTVAAATSSQGVSATMFQATAPPKSRRFTSRGYRHALSASARHGTKGTLIAQRPPKSLL